jgi:hypothetical protein
LEAYETYKRKVLANDKGKKWGRNVLFCDLKYWLKLTAIQAWDDSVEKKENEGRKMRLKKSAKSKHIIWVIGGKKDRWKGRNPERNNM